MGDSLNPYYHVFLSHSHDDSEVVKALAERLEGDFGLRVWLDVWELVPGRSFIEGIQQGLSEARNCAICLGPGTQEGWLKLEIGNALNRQAREPDFGVIPVLLPGADEASAGDFLQLNTWVDLRGGVTDSDAVYKLVCGIQGLPPGSGRTPGGDRTEHTGQSQAAVAPHVQAAAATQRAALCPLNKFEFSDGQVLDVVQRLRRIHSETQKEFLQPEVLFPELDLLFDRKTFRYESLRKCPERRWGDRLDSAYQTQRVIKAYLRNVQTTASAKLPAYRDLVGELESYAMAMGAHLFDPPVDHELVRTDIGKTSFKTLLPPIKRFGNGVYPDIPDNDNSPIETHRKRAVKLMNQLVQDLAPEQARVLS